jgi:hypothetical protein
MNLTHIVPRADAGLIAERGADNPVAWMRPLKCAGCGGRGTEMRVTAPSKRGGW